jgi:hypothetical protein
MQHDSSNNQTTQISSRLREMSDTRCPVSEESHELTCLLEDDSDLEEADSTI